MRHPSLNGTMPQFLHVEMVAMVFVLLMFLMLVFVAQQLTYTQNCSRNSSSIYQGYSWVFQVVGDSLKLEESFWKWEGIFTINNGYITGKKLFFHKWVNAPPMDFLNFSYFGGCKINEGCSPNSHQEYPWYTLLILNV